ncbi:thioredoxin family protein [Pseudomonas sp. TE3610]
MASYSQLFALGLPFDTFVATGLPAEIATVTQARQSFAGLDEQRLAAIKDDYYLLAAGEMWCPDCQLNLTALQALSLAQPRVHLGIISKSRAEHDLRERLGLEKVSIPLVVVLDSHFEQVGLFVERPRLVVEGDDEVLAAYKAGQHQQATADDVLAIIEAAQARR